MAHVKEAQRTLGSKFTWICDAIDNPIKHAMGNAPNSEFVIDREGKLLRKRSWSNAAALRADLEELVGTVENPTDPADLKLDKQPPPRAAAKGVLKRIKLPEGLRALVIEPEVLLLDEPTSALDPISTGAIEDLIEDLKQDYTIAIVTHNMQQAARISDYTAYMYLGDMVEIGKTDQVFTNPTQKATEDYITGRYG